jgi:hypothetical protein
MKKMTSVYKKLSVGLLTIMSLLFLSTCSSPLADNNEVVKSNLSILPVSVADETITFTLQMPAANPIIAPERDFYILGEIIGEIPENTLLTVQLYRGADGKLMREVYTDIKANKDGIYWDYPLITLYGTNDPDLVKDSMMPDLIYDPSDLHTFQEQWRKCYYDDYNFTATFNGGRYTYDVYPYDQWGEPYEPILEGEYTVVVVALSSQGELLGRDVFPLTVGYNAEKVMSRFSPPAHYANIAAFASQYDYTLYTDPFAGLFDTVQFLVNYPAGMEIWINRKWRIGDLIEYETGRVHFLIYDVATNSTTWAVELGAIQASQTVEDPNRLLSYYYDIGDVAVGNRVGTFIPFLVNDKLQIPRIDFPSGPTIENYIVYSDLATVSSDFDLSDGVYVTAGSTISIFGVVKPIQVSTNDLDWNEITSEYIIRDRASTVEYHIQPEDSLDYFIVRNIGLQREFASDNIVESLLEFKNNLYIDPIWANSFVDISLVAYDSHDRLIPGSYEEFRLFVSQ